jgi:hypothetical protein
MQDLQKKLPMSESDIVSKVNTEYEESIEFTRNKREIFKRRDKLYLWINDQEEKLYVRYVYSVIDTLLALETSDERSVIFAWRKVGMEDYANNINNVAKYDYEQMWCFKKKYQTRRDKYMYWPRIEVMDMRDESLQVPTYKVISPLVWCPDWFADVNNWARYHWFEFSACRWELENNPRYFNKDKMYSKQQLDTLETRAKQSQNTQRVLADPIILSSNDIISLYYHYTTIKWKKYLAVLSNERSLLIRFEEIPAMTDIEKKDNTKITFPVIVWHRRPLRYDPFGVCVPDLLEDKEAMTQLFLNLKRIKAEHEALWDMFMYDPDKVDVNSLTIPALWPKYVPVTWLWSMQYPAMMEVPKWNIKQDEQIITSEIMNQWTLAIGMDNQTLWIAWANNMTATENQRIQANSNLRMLLWIKFDNEAEKDFWTRWYKFYLYYFDSTKEKNFKLNDSVWENFYSVKKKDFLGITDIDVEIRGKADLDAKTEKERIWFMAVAQFVLNDPTSSESSKKFALREMLRLNWVPQEKVNMMVKPTNEEQKATEHLQLLNRNEMPPKINNLNEDHWTYITIYNRAFDTDAKWKAISRRMIAMQESWQSISQSAPIEAGAMWNMVMNQLMQQSNQQEKWANSLTNIRQ